MALNIDKHMAEEVLRSAYDNRKLLKDITASKISDVLQGSHKTYRYVLITSLLAKSTDEDADVFSLQAQDDSIGAYDARSLCHKVIVPFERDILPNGLGGSNEPYLNKPARFPRIADTNAVRKGNDTIALHKLIQALNAISNSSQAKKYLCHAVAVMEENHKLYESQFQFEPLDTDVPDSIQNIMDYLSTLLDKSCEGEVCPIAIATVEQLFLGNLYKVVPHKVNECGASSKEIGDIDIYDSENEIFMSIEVKDKIFTKEDVEHAIIKFHSGRVKNSMFIYGKKVSLPSDSTSLFQLLGRFGRMGYFCSIICVIDYLRIRLLSVPELSLSSFVNLMLQQAKVINATHETILWIKEAANEQGL